MDGDVLPGKTDRQPALLFVRAVGSAGLPLPRRPIRELDFALGGIVGGAAGAVGTGHRTDQPRGREQPLHADRPDPDDRAVGEERAPDRRDGPRSRNYAWQADPRSRGRRSALTVP